jgi:hypothetical protein
VKSFFVNMNLARAIIVMSLLGSIFLAWKGWKSHQELVELRDSLNVQVPKMVEEIQQLSETHTRLMRDKEGDKFLTQATPELYIRGIGDKPSLAMGNLTLDPRKEYPVKGIVDQQYRITPDKRETGFSRGKIALFLYYLEAESRRIKVTEAEISLNDAKTKPHEIPTDAWTFNATVTSRQKEEG